MATSFQPATWYEKASGSGAAQTATHAGESGNRHLLKSVVASFTGSGDVGALILKDGATEIFEVDVHGNIELEFPDGWLFSSGADVVAELADAGGGATGKVVIAGATIEG